MSLSTASPRPTICLVPHFHGLGGPASFQGKLEAGLTARGIPVTYDLTDPHIHAILVNGGPVRAFPGLWQAHQRGVRIVQRLDGMNWTHRRAATGLRHYLRSEWINLALSRIRCQLADRVVYQSQFTQRWWEQVYGKLSTPSRVIYNGVDLTAYSPAGPECPPEDELRLVMIETHMGGGHELSLENGVRLASRLREVQPLPVRLQVIGDVPAAARAQMERQAPGLVEWIGSVPRERIPAYDRSAHLFFSAEINAACPNAAIEALACGLPVVAFDTGALTELIQGDAGRVVPYHGDYWHMQPADPRPLAEAITALLPDLPHYRRAARERAEAVFGLDQMVASYLDFLL